MGNRTIKGHEYSDSDLVKRCAEGDIRSQEFLYRRYFSFAMSICIRYTRDEGEAMEVVNDSYLKVLDSLQEYDHSRPFRSWYGKILVNTAIDSYRKNLKNNSQAKRRWQILYSQRTKMLDNKWRLCAGLYCVCKSRWR